MKKLKSKNSGFTLIELMIVFVIIIVLAGMVLRLMGPAGSKNAEAITREKLERVAQALEEFRAIYGRYPPVDYYPGGTQPMEYEYPGPEGPSVPSDIVNVIRQRSRTENIWKGDDKGHGRVFTFGLLSYFFPRYKGHAEYSPVDLIGRKEDGKYAESRAVNQWRDYNDFSKTEDMADIVQNVESARRILPYLGASLRADGSVEKYGIVKPHPVARKVSENDPDDMVYNNVQLRLRDGWYRMILYRSRPPYDSYKLWSSGPDGKTEPKDPDCTEDDIVVGQG